MRGTSLEGEAGTPAQTETGQTKKDEPKIKVGIRNSFIHQGQQIPKKV